MRRMARRWHRDNPNFTLSALRAIGRCKSEEEIDLALAYQREALAIRFWSKKDIVQYVVACLHARGSLTEIGSFRAFLDHFTEADRDVMQQFIDAAPVHYWTYAARKTRGAERDNNQ